MDVSEEDGWLMEEDKSAVLLCSELSGSIIPVFKNISCKQTDEKTCHSQTSKDIHSYALLFVHILQLLRLVEGRDPSGPIVKERSPRGRIFHLFPHVAVAVFRCVGHDSDRRWTWSWTWIGRGFIMFS